MGGITEVVSIWIASSMSIIMVIVKVLIVVVIDLGSVVVVVD